MAVLEKEIERSILQYLELLPECFAWKNNNVGVYDARKRVYRKPKSKYLPQGVPDILGIYQGRFMCIEVKTPQRRKNTTEHQKNFLEQIKVLGGISMVATSIEDVREELAKLN